MDSQQITLEIEHANSLHCPQEASFSNPRAGKQYSQCINLDTKTIPNKFIEPNKEFDNMINGL